MLSEGEIISPKLTPIGSNYTFLCGVRHNSRELKAVYKPRDGEVPLWDFPSGTLYKREYAAYLFSQMLGWDFIPPTIIRDGPYGVGTVQFFVDHDPRVNYFNLRDSHVDDLKVMACFDLAANNTDRKAGHCIQDAQGRLWGIDHGLTFHSMIKVRTVIWDFAGEPIPEPLLERLSGFLNSLRQQADTVADLAALLHDEEVAALEQRISWLLELREYPGLTRRRT